MLPKRVIILLAELRESFRMALTAVAAHKLRSVLTLLGVLVGVFSIIVVMTALRVMQSFVESELSQLGDQTFMVRKFPTILFNRPEGLEKIRRRKNITLQEGLRLKESATLARAVGVESLLLGRPDSDTATSAQRRMSASMAKPRTVSPPATGSCRTDAASPTLTWKARATSACLATALPGPFSPPAQPLANG